jgi:hypothetical protein
MDLDLYGGDSSEKDILIPVRLTEESPIEFIPKGEASQIVFNEVQNQARYYQTLSESQKEEYLAKLIVEHLKLNPSILDREITECTLNKLVYGILTMFYLPDNIANTIASWVAWFLRGLYSVTWSFVSGTVMYMLTHWQRLLILVAIDLFVIEQLGFAFVRKGRVLADIASGDDSNLGVVDKIMNMMGVTGQTGFELLGEVKTYTQYFVWASYGIELINYAMYIKDSLAEINANCMVSENALEPSAQTKRRMEQQLDQAFNEIILTDAMQEGIAQSRVPKELSAEEFEQQFIDHVQTAIETTPVHDITTLIDAPTATPENITADQYNMALVKNSIRIQESVRPKQVLPEIVPSIQMIDLNADIGEPAVQPQPIVDPSIQFIPLQDNVINPVQDISNKLNKSLSIVLHQL